MASPQNSLRGRGSVHEDEPRAQQRAISGPRPPRSFTWQLADRSGPVQYSNVPVNLNLPLAQPAQPVGPDPPSRTSPRPGVPYSDPRLAQPAPALRYVMPLPTQRPYSQQPPVVQANTPRAPAQPTSPPAPSPQLPVTPVQPPVTPAQPPVNAAQPPIVASPVKIASLPSSPLAEATSAEEEEEEEITDDDVWKNGDFELISSDNVRFMVPSFHLYSASAVFRDMYGLNLDAERKVNMIDPDFENAKTLRLFLQLASTGRFADTPAYNTSTGADQLLALLDFTKKWEAEPTRNSLWYILSNDRNTANCGMWTFKVAAYWEQAALCVTLIRARTPQTWAAGGTALTNATDKASVYDPYHWPYELVKGMPQKYMWALGRAYGSAIGKEGGLAAHLANEFEKYIRAAE